MCRRGVPDAVKPLTTESAPVRSLAIEGRRERTEKAFLVSLGLLALLVLAPFAVLCVRFHASPLFAYNLWASLPWVGPNVVLLLAVGTTGIVSILAVRYSRRRLHVPLAFAAGCLALAALAPVHLRYPRYGDVAKARRDVEAAGAWLWRNPPNGLNRADRRSRMRVIQNACDHVRPEDFDAYRDSWYNRTWLASHGYGWMLPSITRTSDQFEADNPALAYLRQATSRAMEDIHATKVDRGLAVWHIYNMGYVFKTPEKCFGIDVMGPGVERLADDLDFLLVTHRHWDHFWEPLKDRMIQQGKPVVVHANLADLEPQAAAGCVLVKKPGAFQFGDVRVNVIFGDHMFPADKEQAKLFRNFVLMYEIHCGLDAFNSTIYDAGDADNVDKMMPPWDVDLLIQHAATECARTEVRKLKPNMVIAGHVLELGHSPKMPRPGRVSYDMAYRWALKGIPQDGSATLTWGERWLWAGTVLKKDGLGLPRETDTQQVPKLADTSSK